MIINKETSFIKTYFDGKSGDELRGSITPIWNTGTLAAHLGMVAVPLVAESVLEVGCGIGRLLKPIAMSGRECFGVDASESMIKEGIDYVKGKNVKLLLCSGDGEISLEDNLVDFAFSIITFQHIPNTETVKKYISEMIRVTKPHGEIMFQVLAEDNNNGFLWSYHDIQKLLLHLDSLDVELSNIQKFNRWTVFRCRV